MQQKKLGDHEAEADRLNAQRWLQFHTRIVGLNDQRVALQCGVQAFAGCTIGARSKASANSCPKRQNFTMLAFTDLGARSDEPMLLKPRLERIRRCECIARDVRYAALDIAPQIERVQKVIEQPDFGRHGKALMQSHDTSINILPVEATEHHLKRFNGALIIVTGKEPRSCKRC